MKKSMDNQAGLNTNPISTFLCLIAMSTVILTNSCDKSSDTFIDEPMELQPFSRVKDVKKSIAATPINFAAEMVNCYAGGITVKLLIENSNDYLISWEIDQTKTNLTGNKLSCICGTNVTAIVKRHSDELVMSRTFILPKCNDEAVK